MKEKERLQLHVGLFIFFSLLVTAIVVFTLGDQKNIFSSEFSVYCYFDDISGLRVGAPVYLAGLTVGKVDNIRLSKELKHKKVEVKLSIKSKYQERIRADSKASIQSQGILGDKLIHVSVGSAPYKMIKDRGVIAAETMPTLDDFIGKGSELLDNLNMASRKINTILGTEEGDETVKNISSMTKSLRNILEEVETGDGMLHNIIYDEKDDKVNNNLAEMSHNIRLTTENFRVISEKIRSGEGSLGGLINDPTVYYDLKTLLGKANRNKLLRSVIRYTLRQKEENLLGSGKE